MRICKVKLRSGESAGGLIEGDLVRLLTANVLAEYLHAASPEQAIQKAVVAKHTSVPLAEVTMLAPVDQQEIWAAGVTYKRSQEARERESWSHPLVLI